MKGHSESGPRAISLWPKNLELLGSLEFRAWSYTPLVLRTQSHTHLSLSQLMSSPWHLTTWPNTEETYLWFLPYDFHLGRRAPARWLTRGLFLYIYLFIQDTASYVYMSEIKVISQWVQCSGLWSYHLECAQLVRIYFSVLLFFFSSGSFSLQSAIESNLC